MLDGESSFRSPYCEPRMAQSLSQPNWSFIQVKFEPIQLKSNQLHSSTKPAKPPLTELELPKIKLTVLRTIQTPTHSTIERCAWSRRVVGSARNWRVTKTSRIQLFQTCTNFVRLSLINSALKPHPLLLQIRNSWWYLSPWQVHW